MLVTREIKTIYDLRGVPVLEIIREAEMITILEAEDMDRPLQFPAAMLPAILNTLGSLM